jgi:hypothetical protein
MAPAEAFPGEVVKSKSAECDVDAKFITGGG